MSCYTIQRHDEWRLKTARDIPAFTSLTLHLFFLGPVIRLDTGDKDKPSTRTSAEGTASLPTTIGLLPPRYGGSPLRPSQWVARGGLLSSPRHQPHAPDRYISCRRPANVTRESFELNKPAERLATERSVARGDRSRIDPFGARLHRSARMNDELQNLRETHTILTGRASLNRHGISSSLRRGSLAVWNREVSAGAVWNVGGSPVVSDTVVGVPNGRGGLLGSGTNAPLYTSMFLSRPDPEAALEAYEQRLALALGIDQNDRILDHSTLNSPLKVLTASSSSIQSPGIGTPHVWRDGAWTRDGVASRLFGPSFLVSSVLTRSSSQENRNSEVEEDCASFAIQIGILCTSGYAANSMHSAGCSAIARRLLLFPARLLSHSQMSRRWAGELCAFVV